MEMLAYGRVVEPMVSKTRKGKEIASFGLLNGQTSEKLDVFRNDEGKGSNDVFNFCSGLKDGDSVVVSLGAGVSDRGYVRYYVNKVNKCTPDLIKTLKGVFAVQ